MSSLQNRSPFKFTHNHGQPEPDALDEGGIPMAELLAAAGELCPEATLALEVMEARRSVDWLGSIGAI